MEPDKLLIDGPNVADPAEGRLRKVSVTRMPTKNSSLMTARSSEHSGHDRFVGDGPSGSVAPIRVFRLHFFNKQHVTQTYNFPGSLFANRNFRSRLCSTNSFIN